MEFLIKNNKFRYQYQDHRLLTIFSDTKICFMFKMQILVFIT